VVLLGPGASVHPQTVGLMRNAVSQILRPLVLDADALNAFAGPELGKLKAAQLLLNGPPEAATRAAETLARDRHLSSTIAGQEPRDEAGEADLSPASARSRPLLAFDPSSGARRPVVLLPHPGELARLLDTSIREVQRNRRRAARECVMETQCVVALKGAGTIVCDGSREYLNPSGNSGLATGGTGDVLAGLLAALLAQKLPPFEAACLAVYLHGLAGDLAAKRLGLWSMVAGDVLDELPQAFLLYSGQSAPSGT
jgi:NAD(P)H-hydrate repair Nnr-like enzyme with NAD(P)H-hydrate dehydratase domain